MTLRASLVLLLLSSSVAVAAGTKKDEDWAPRGLLYGEKDLSRILFRCAYTNGAGTTTLTKTNTIKCEFEQVLLTVPSAADVAAHVAQAERDFEPGWKEA